MGEIIQFVPQANTSRREFYRQPCDKAAVCEALFGPTIIYAGGLNYQQYLDTSPSEILPYTAPGEDGA